MKCTNCDIDCDVTFSKEKKFCLACGCSYLDHADYASFNDECLGMVNQICMKNKGTERNIEESTKLAKTFGTVWLPFGIQPSEVDRFLKYFPNNTDIRRTMFMKSDQRCIEIKMQLPVQDRSSDNLAFLNGDAAITQAATFFDRRLNENCEVARIDHLDRSEGNTCFECQDSMGFGEVCVMLPKSKKMSSEVWHPHCFKCTKCQHLLVDYLFCWDVKSNTGPYCLRHFDDKYNARCVSCDEMIFDENYPTVLGESYHHEHLRCCTCKSIISNSQFVLQSDPSIVNKLWKCVDCLKETNETFCVICSKLIDANVLSVTMDGLMTHDSCVKCHVCHDKISLSSPFTYVRERNCLFCLKCNAQRNSENCIHCKEKIVPYEDNCVSYGLYSWHSDCLKCIKCMKQVVNNEEFIFVVDATNLSRVTTKLSREPKWPVCKNCFMAHHGDICERCKERVDETGIKYNEKLFHKSCFLCYNCKEELNSSTFTTKDEHTYCLSCHSQLFCKTCSCCSKPILGYERNEKMISFENRNWHEDCFICTNCEKLLIDSGFLFDNEKIVCIECGVK